MDRAVQTEVQSTPAAATGPVFVIRLRAGPGRDVIHALRRLLKYAGRHAGLRCLSVSEEHPQCDQSHSEKITR
jgi:hypothetical protein